MCLSAFSPISGDNTESYSTESQNSSERLTGIFRNNSSRTHSEPWLSLLSSRPYLQFLLCSLSWLASLLHRQFAFDVSSQIQLLDGLTLRNPKLHLTQWSSASYRSIKGSIAKGWHKILHPLQTILTSNQNQHEFTNKLLSWECHVGRTKQNNVTCFLFMEV